METSGILKHQQASGNMQKHREKHMKTLLLIGLTLLLFILVSCMAQSTPAHAQAPFQTPTPLPIIQEQLNAAQQRSDAARSDLQQADAMDARAAELRRNGLAQQAQAQNDLSNARAAVAAQNYEAIGEQIGRAQSDIEQLSRTNAAQADMITALTDNQKVQANAIISASNEITQLRADVKRLTDDKQLISASLETFKAQKSQDEKTSAVGNIVAAFEFIVALVLVFAFGAFVVSRRRGTETQIKSTPNQTGIDDGETIEGEMVGDEPID